MNHKKNVKEWMEYVKNDWLNRKGQPHFHPSTGQLLNRMEELLADSTNFEEACHYIEKIEKLLGSFRYDPDYPKESARVLLECGFASYLMGNLATAIISFEKAIKDCTDDHDRAIGRCMLGLVYWLLGNEVEALLSWENGVHDFREKTRKIDRNKADTEWYADTQEQLEKLITYVVDYKELPYPSRMKSNSNNKSNLLPETNFGTNFRNNDKKHMLSSVPLVGSIPAGIPLGVLPDPVGFMEVDQVILEGKKYRIVSLLRGEQVVNLPVGQRFFILYVRGNSMNQTTPERIENGDYVILHEQNTAESGDIVAVEIVGVDDRATLKRYKVESDTIFLIPESTDPEFKKPVYLDHIFTKLDVGFYVRGKAVAVLKPV